MRETEQFPCMSSGLRDGVCGSHGQKRSGPLCLAGVWGGLLCLWDSVPEAPHFRCGTVFGVAHSQTGLSRSQARWQGREGCWPRQDAPGVGGEGDSANGP